MLKNPIITILLLVYFFCVHFVLFFIAYWTYYSLTHYCFFTGPDACQVSMAVMGTLSLTPLISSPLSTLIFIKSKKKVKLLLILFPVVLIFSILLIYNTIKI